MFNPRFDRSRSAGRIDLEKKKEIENRPASIRYSKLVFISKSRINFIFFFFKVENSLRLSMISANCHLEKAFDLVKR